MVSSVQAVKPHPTLAGFALVGVPAGLDAVLKLVHDLHVVKTGMTLK